MAIKQSTEELIQLIEKASSNSGGTQTNREELAAALEVSIAAVALGDSPPASGGGLVSVTKAEVDTLIANKELAVGSTYEISGVDVPLYGGTTIIVTAIATDRLSLEGSGVFYNPKYDNTVSGFNVWDDGATYIATDKAHWGGMTWINQTGVVGTAVDEFTLDAVNWTVIPFDAIEYTVATDKIKYDYVFDVIVERNEKNANIVSFNQITLQHFQGRNPIREFMWGNLPFDFYYDYQYYDWEFYLYLQDDIFGVANCRIINSLFSNINFKGYAQMNITLEDFSYQLNCTFKTGSFQQDISLKGRSFQYGLNFSNGSFQKNVIIDGASYVRNMTVDAGIVEKVSLINNCYILDFIATSGGLQIVTLEDTCYLDTFTLVSIYARNLHLEDNSTMDRINVNTGQFQNMNLSGSSSVSNIIMTVGSQMKDVEVRRAANVRNFTMIGPATASNLIIEQQSSLSNIEINNNGYINNSQLSNNSTLRETGFVAANRSWSGMRMNSYKLDKNGLYFADQDFGFVYSPELISKPTTVAALPNGTADNQARYIGMRGFVTDALAPAYLSTVAAGGAVFTGVVWDGTNWIVQ